MREGTPRTAANKAVNAAWGSGWPAGGIAESRVPLAGCSVSSTARFWLGPELEPFSGSLCPAREFADGVGQFSVFGRAACSVMRCGCLFVFGGSLGGYKYDPVANLLHVRLGSGGLL